jgi:hypothetical protein
MKNITILLLLILSVSLFSGTLKINSIIGQSVVGVAKNRSSVLKSGSFYLQGNKETTSDVAEFLPLSYSLEQNYPNPFNPSTMIKFSLPEEQNVKITVYNVLGKEVATIASGKFKDGNHSVIFDGSKFVSGQYFYTISAGKFTQIRKMLLIK